VRPCNSFLLQCPSCFSGRRRTSPQGTSEHHDRETCHWKDWPKTDSAREARRRLPAIVQPSGRRLISQPAAASFGRGRNASDTLRQELRGPRMQPVLMLRLFRIDLLISLRRGQIESSRHRSSRAHLSTLTGDFRTSAPGAYLPAVSYSVADFVLGALML
jgi:hypothetical protein